MRLAGSLGCLPEASTFRCWVSVVHPMHLIVARAANWSEIHQSLGAQVFVGGVVQVHAGMSGCAAHVAIFGFS
jgi:hypothetical protein